MLLIMTFALTPSALALRINVPPSSALSSPIVSYTAPHLTRHAPVTMRDSGDESGGFSKYLSVSVDAWAKTAKERPAFFVLRVVILSSGLYFFATLAGALVQRAL